MRQECDKKRCVLDRDREEPRSYADILMQLRKTMGSIKHVLTERWYQFEDARVLAETDPEVDMYANPAAGEQPYIPARMVSDMTKDARQH